MSTDESGYEAGREAVWHDFLVRCVQVTLARPENPDNWLITLWDVTEDRLVDAEVASGASEIACAIEAVVMPWIDGCGDNRMRVHLADPDRLAVDTRAVLHAFGHDIANQTLDPSPRNLAVTATLRFDRDGFLADDVWELEVNIASVLARVPAPW